jgi:death on curing protein
MTDRRWVSLKAVLAAHDRLLAEYGGAEGVIDLGGLEGALDRPKNLAAYGDPDISELTAMYAMAIAKAHAFVDGNKRTAWSTAGAFLRLNGYTLAFNKVEAVPLMVAVADDTVAFAALAEWFHSRLHYRGIGRPAAS